MTRLQKIAAGAALFLAVTVEVALAASTTYTYKDAALNTFLIQIFGSGPYYTAMVLENSSGTEVATAGAPLRIDPTGTTTQPVSAASWPLPTGAGTAANQIAVQVAPGATAPAKGLFIGGVYNSSLPSPSTGQFEGLQLDASGRLIVNCVTGCAGSGGTAVVDESAFTFGTTALTPAGGVFQTTATSNPLTTGQTGAWQMTAYRAGMVNLRTAAGAEIGTAASPAQVSLANTGANSTAILTTGTGGTFPATESGTWTVQPGNTPNTSPWLMTIHQGSNSANVSAGNALLVDASATTQPVSIASAFPLPTGASTSSLQTTGNSTLTTINTSLGTINTTLGSAATAALQTTGNASLATIATNTGEPIPAQVSHTVNIGAVDSISPYPATAVPITASTTGTTAATTATLTNVSGHLTYICGFSIRANATSAATGNATVTGTVTGTLNFTQWTAPNSSGLGVTEEVFSPCIPASAVSTSIAVISSAASTGGVVSVTAWGYSI
jgi:hypothetical protein